MSYVKIWLHCVWGTKNRYPYLDKNRKQMILAHIKDNAKSKGIYIDKINGGIEHVHCIISLKPDQSISKVMQLIKGESSNWINKQSIYKNNFEWADEYYAASISESLLPNVRNYLQNQEKHHRIKEWKDEVEEFIRDSKVLQGLKPTSNSSTVSPP